jgi:GcrA cell cycle regulator
MTAGISYGSPRGAGSLGDIVQSPRAGRDNFVPVPATLGIPFDRGQWTETSIEALRTLYGLGYSTKAIGDYIGFTKNAIVGKSHRIDLPPRPSPIIRDGRPPKDDRPAYVRPRVTLPPLASQVGDTAVVQFALPLAVLKPVIVAPRPVRAVLAPVVALPVVKPVPVPKPFARVGECQWTDSDCSPWLWCCDPTVNGGSWCVTHHKRVFINRRSFMEAAD